MTWPDGFCPNGWSILPVSTSLMVELVHFHTPTICDAKSCDAAGWAKQIANAVAAAADANKCFMVSSKLARLLLEKGQYPDHSGECPMRVGTLDIGLTFPDQFPIRA